MADTIEEQNKLMSEWGKTMAEMRKKTKEISKSFTRKSYLCFQIKSSFAPSMPRNNH